MLGSFTCYYMLLVLIHTFLCAIISLMSLYTVNSFTWQCMHLAHLLLNIVSSHVLLYTVGSHPCAIVYSWLSFVCCVIRLALTCYHTHLTLIHKLLSTVVSFTCYTVDSHSPAFICSFHTRVHSWLSVMPCCM